jgi:hypothetical protein
VYKVYYFREAQLCASTIPAASRAAALAAFDRSVAAFRVNAVGAIVG